MKSIRKPYDWRKIHDELDRRLSRLGSSYDNDDARAQALLKERSARLALVATDRQARATLTRVLIFAVNGERYALALGRAQEITRLSRIVVLPGSSASILGIINWRGEFVTVFDTARLLGTPPAGDSMPRYAIVLRSEDPRVALAIDAPECITRLDLSKLQPPDQLGTKGRAFSKGVTDQAVLVLEEDKLLAGLKEDLRAA